MANPFHDTGANKVENMKSFSDFSAKFSGKHLHLRKPQEIEYYLQDSKEAKGELKKHREKTEKNAFDLREMLDKNLIWLSGGALYLASTSLFAQYRTNLNFIHLLKAAFFLFGLSLIFIITRMFIENISNSLLIRAQTDFDVITRLLERENLSTNQEEKDLFLKEAAETYEYYVARIKYGRNLGLTAAVMHSLIFYLFITGMIVYLFFGIINF